MNDIDLSDGMGLVRVGDMAALPQTVTSAAPSTRTQPHLWVFAASLACVVAACSNSARLTRRHLKSSGPQIVRSATVRILFMVPLYSVESWLALVCGASEFNNVLSVLRKGYECLLVTAFAELLLVWLGGLDNLIELLEHHRCRHLPPCSLLLPSWAPASRFVRRTLTGVVQYVPCSLFATSVFLVSWCGADHAPHALHSLQVACMICMNASQACAVYCLITFYHANRAMLGPFKPIQKMLSVKFVFFLAFWQEMAVRTAEFSGAFDNLPAALTDGYTCKQVGGAILNCLICLEMFVLSLMHPYVWPPGEATQAVFMSPETADGRAASPEVSANGDQEDSGLRDEECKIHDDESSMMSGWQVCRRFVNAFDLSDIPGFVGSVRRLGKPGAQQKPRKDSQDSAGLEFVDLPLSPKMRNRVSRMILV